MVVGMVCFVTAWSINMAYPFLSLLCLVVAVSAWIAINRVTVRALRLLPRINATIELAPDTAQQQIDAGLELWPLQPAVRMLFYHRLAALRHRQQRYVESTAIVTLVLTRREGLQKSLSRYAENGAQGSPLATDGASPDQFRAQLLLLMVDGRLRCGDELGAYLGLADLHRMVLSLPNQLQRLALQTRYEIAVGQTSHALRNLEHKLGLFELLPAGECGVMHMFLAIAAIDQDKRSLAHRLRRRARLLCTPTQFVIFETMVRQYTHSR